MTYPWPKCLPIDLATRTDAFAPFTNIVDWGCGPYNLNPISASVLGIDCNLLTSVDIFSSYESIVLPKQTSAKKHIFVCEDILKLSRKMVEEEQSIDLSLCLDIVEHLEYDDASEFIRNVCQISRVTLIWIPLGNAPIESDEFGYGNEHMIHRSTWTASQLRALGLKVQVIRDFHTERFGWRVDGGWAWNVNS